MTSQNDIFTPAEATQIRDTFGRTFGASLRPGERFSVSGTNVDGRLEVVLVLADPERTEVATFVAGHDVGHGAPLSEIDARAHAVEFLHAAIHDYLQSGRFPRPHLDWREYTFDNKKVYLRGSVVNEALEAQADALLAAAGEEE